MQSRKYTKQRYFLVLLLCGVAIAASLGVGLANNKAYAIDDSDTVTVYYSLYIQRELDNEIRVQEHTNEDSFMYTWYKLDIPKGNTVNKDELDSSIAFKVAGFFTDEDKDKITNRKITWYQTNYKKSVDLDTDAQKKHALYAFNSSVNEDIYLEGIVEENTEPQEDTKWMFWLIMGLVVGVVVVAIIMAIIRNRNTRLSLDNKRLMTPESKQKVEEIESIERRKEQYSPLNDDNEAF